MALMDPEGLSDKDVMTPIDIQDDCDTLGFIEKHGPKGTAEAFVKAETLFSANMQKFKDSGISVESWPKPISAQEWKAQMLEGESVGAEEGGEEEEPAADEEEAGDEPADK